MNRWSRLANVIGLSLRINLQSKLKLALLTTLIAISTLVFLSVSELSRASRDSLTSALDEDLGKVGTYRVSIAPGLGLEPGDLFARMRQALTPYSSQVLVAERFTDVHPECPPYDRIGTVTALVLLDDEARSVPFQAGAGLPSESEPTYTIVVITGSTQDQTGPIRNALQESLREPAAQAAVELDNVVVVTRGDTGEAVRSASAGVALVYRLIGWGVLIVGGLGVLVSELIVLRDRTWFFGLARAVGARRGDVGLLVIADIALVLFSGIAMAVLVAFVSGPVVTSFGHQTLQADLQLLRPSTLPQLTLGLLAMLVLAGAYPAWRASRLDPLDVLERR